MKRLIACAALLLVVEGSCGGLGFTDEPKPEGSRCRTDLNGAIDDRWIRRSDFGIKLDPPIEFPIPDVREQGIPANRWFGEVLEVQRISNEISNERKALQTLNDSLKEVISKFPGTAAADLAEETRIGVRSQRQDLEDRHQQFIRGSWWGGRPAPP